MGEQRGKMRLTRKVFWDLAIWMVGLGLIVGLVFPFFALLLGVPGRLVLRPQFFAATLGAGFLVGGINYALARGVVGRRVRLLARQMHTVQSSISEAMYSGDWSGCDPEACQIPSDSDDEIGESASAFNGLINALARSHQIEEAMRSFSSVMSDKLDSAEVADAALEAFLRHSRSAAGAVLLIEEDGRRVIASSGILEPGRLVSSAPIIEATRRGTPVRVDVPDDVAIDGAAVSFRPRCVTACPVLAEGRPVAVVVLAGDAPLDADVERLFEMLCRTFTVALMNASAHERLARMATVDPLTGLYNRRLGLRRLHEECSRARRSGAGLGVLMIDVDHFKSVNDTYGHAAGDAVLVSVAAAVSSILREEDVLIRYGGDELLVLIPGCDSQTLESVGLRICEAVERAAVVDGDVVLRATVSIGGATYPSLDAPDEATLLRRADEALYASKRGTRNTMSLAG